ncbi:hypothetical protein NSPZN2_40141 [Nitrospira defluvii]|uniref:Uncharacterized protein n=1 Tax=Nitrospira defluvii TaxID=330214 RepID=A0ABN7LY85_9BACT|nr:hypothetical protein NSPZN2_40141 [Nitrospira defluvii]
MHVRDYRHALTSLLPRRTMLLKSSLIIVHVEVHRGNREFQRPGGREEEIRQGICW